MRNLAHERQIRTMHGNSGHKHPKRLKAGRRTTIKAKYTQWDVFRQADAKPDVRPEITQLRTAPVQRTGMDIHGEFVTYRDRNGQMVFLTVDGQTVRK